MAKMKSDYWRGSGPEPTEYARVHDPLHGFREDSSTMSDAVTRVSNAIKGWMETKSAGGVDEAIASLKTEWLKNGGSHEKWDLVVLKAFQTSGYARQFQREVNKELRSKKR